MRFLFTNSAPIISYGLATGFSQLGHSVKVVHLTNEYRKDNKVLYRIISTYNPDFVICEGGDSLYPLLFPALDNLHVPLIYWAIEDPPDFERLSLPFARKARYVFTPALECIEQYAHHGIKAHLLMFACNPDFHKKVPPRKDLKNDIVFTGNNYFRHAARNEGRQIILEPIINAGLNIKIYGLDWWLNPAYGFTIGKNLYGGYMPYEDLPGLYASTKIALGLHSVNTSPTMMSMRTFEVLGCEAFYLTQHTPAIESLFTNYKHLVWSKSSEQTLELVRYYLEHDTERQAIASAGQQEVYAHHTYKQRAQDILNIIRRY